MWKDFGTVFICTVEVPFWTPPSFSNDNRFPECFLDGELLSGEGTLVFEDEAIAEPLSTFFPDPEVDDMFHFIK
jgi:hypothetical protein